MHVPLPLKASQSSALKIPVLHESGQQRLISLPYSVQYWVESMQLYEIPHAGEVCRHSLLSFGMHESVSMKWILVNGFVKRT